MNSSPFRAYQDAACLDLLPAESFDAQSLPGTISAVARSSSCFFVCHPCLQILYGAVAPPFIGGEFPSAINADATSLTLHLPHYSIWVVRQLNAMSLTFRVV